MDLISPLPCPPEDLPQLPEARAALVDELERRGRVALAALLPVLALLWVTLRRAAEEDRRIAWLLASVLAVGLLRVALQRRHAGTPEARHLRFTIGSTFQLIVLPENREMLGLLRKMGWIHQAKLAGGLYEISFELPDLA